MPASRREFSSQLLGSLMTCGLIDLLWSRDLLAAKVRPTIGAWLGELEEMSRSLRGGRLRDLEFQAQLEKLHARVELEDLIKLIKLDEVEARLRLPDGGAASERVDFGRVLPAGVGFGRKIFGCRKGRSIVPHGHINMCTGFIVLKGEWLGRHYDREETYADHCIIRPTIERAFAPGESSTISDHADNVHWFQARSDAAFLFNVHVWGYDPRIREAPGRLYLDPNGERLPGGTIRAARLTAAECLRKYGRTG